MELSALEVQISDLLVSPAARANMLDVLVGCDSVRMTFECVGEKNNKVPSERPTTSTATSFSASTLSLVASECVFFLFLLGERVS